MRSFAWLAAALASFAAAAAPLSGGGEGLQLTTVVAGLGDVTDFAFLPDGRMVITEKSGALKVRHADGTIATAATFPVDDQSEKGLLGVAVDPQFEKSSRLFLYYSLANEAGGTDLDRQRVISALLEGDKLDLAAAKVLVRGLRGPRNHDGGALAIGPDGKLYIGVGDTGCNSNRTPWTAYEPTNHFGTCLTNANGKILRIELDGTIPDDNPLTHVDKVTACGARCRDTIGAELGEPRREIWAWGFRNPWRFWFDPRTGSLWVGDVGEITIEEIDIAQKGKHHGWPWREGHHGWPRSKCEEIVPNAGPCVEPLYECKHGESKDGIDGDCQSITGGLIIDTCTWPDNQRGRYFFADNANSRVFSLEVTKARDGLVKGSRKQLHRYTDALPVTLHQGPDGDLYIAAFPGNEGRIDKLSPVNPKICAPN